MVSSFNQTDAAVVTWDGGGATDSWGYNDGSRGVGKYLNWGHNGKAPKSGDDLIFAGSVRLNPYNDLTNLTLNSITFAAGAGSYTLLGNAVNLSGYVSNQSSNLQTIHLELGLSSGDHTFSTISDLKIVGKIGDAVNNSAGSIIKTGAASLILTSANTYSGTTTISEGILLANNSSGSATGGSSVIIGTNGILGGTGIIKPSGNNDIQVHGIIAPGANSTPGTLTFDLSTTLSGVIMMTSGAGFQFHLGSPGVGDMLAIVGASNGDFIFNNNHINFMGTGQLGSYKLFDTDSNNSNTWVGLTVNGNGQITGGLTYNNLANGYTATFYMGGGVYGGNSGDIYVQVVPEPDAALIGGIGILLILLRRRRSN